MPNREVFALDRMDVNASLVAAIGEVAEGARRIILPPLGGIGEATPRFCRHG